MFLRMFDRRMDRPALALTLTAMLAGCAGTGGAWRSGAAPAASAQTHTVRAGDTVFALSRRYGVSAGAIQAANQLDGRSSIHVGQRLLIPGGGATRVARAARAANRPSASSRASTRPSSRAVTPARRAATPAQAAASLGPRRLRRPVDGRIIRPFGEGVGARKNAGVDIAAPVGAPVVAAAEGRIAFVSDPTSPVGAVVLMTHPGGMTTIYGRLTDILVSPGQSIAAGAPLARVAPRAGGRSALHFELRHGSDPVNPTPFL